jgi:hypothetical protein
VPPRKKAPPKNQCKLMCCTTPPGAVERIRADIKVWVAGETAKRVNYGPTCSCTLANAKGCILHGDDLPPG